MPSLVLSIPRLLIFLVCHSLNFSCILILNKETGPSNHKLKTFEKIPINEFMIGSWYPNQSYYIDTKDFQGEISDLNIWNRSLELHELKEITSNCGSPQPVPDTFRWSEITSSMVSGNTIEKDITQLCLNSNASEMIYLLFPYLQNQKEAIDTCQMQKIDCPCTHSERPGFHLIFLVAFPFV